MARERNRSRPGGEPRGEWGTSTSRDPYTEPLEEFRRGGGRYDAGPGRELMPTAEEMDRPREGKGAFDRRGERRRTYDDEQPRIQEQDSRGTGR